MNRYLSNCHLSFSGTEPAFKGIKDAGERERENRGICYLDILQELGFLNGSLQNFLYG